MKIAVTSPIYLTNNFQLDLLDRMTMSLLSKQHSLIFIPVENYVHSHFRNMIYNTRSLDTIIVNGRLPQCVAKAWNDGISKARELNVDYVLVVNSDIVLRSDCIDNLVGFANRHNEGVMWTAGQFSNLPELETAVLNLDDNNSSPHPSMSAFLVKPNFHDIMGKFDENFIPAYFEDNDMHARIALSDQTALVYGGAIFFHYGSGIIRTDLGAKISVETANLGAYFVSKWGHGVVGEVTDMKQVYYKHPYNENDKPLSYWRGV